MLNVRNQAIVLSFIAMCLSMFELMRYVFGFGSLPEGDPIVLTWVITSCIGSTIGIMGSFMLQKNLLLLASLVFCCALAPATSNIITLSYGSESQYFIGLTLFMYVIGGL